MFKDYGTRVTLKESLQVVDSPSARPWQKEGWDEVILHWLSRVLPSECQLEATNAHDLACVLCFRTNGEKVYFKTSLNSQEASITARLAEMFPNLVPNVIAYHPEHNWLLTQDPGEWLSVSSQVNEWQASLSALAVFHKAEHNVLEAMRLPFHSFTDLTNRGEAFLLDTPLLQSWGLTQEQLENLEHIIPKIYPAFERVQALSLQECFTHGDAHPNNVLIKEQSLRCFDWSEAGFAHPFLDVGWFLSWTFLPKRDLPFSVTSDTIWQFWNHYLKARGIEDHSVTPFEAMRLTLLHRALVYHEKFYDWQGTTSTARPQYVPYFLRLLMKVDKLENHSINKNFTSTFIVKRIT
jgi:thiamine kinase-like enzyme